MKSIGILCLLAGHSGVKYADYTLLFFLQMFFFNSGYFYKDKYTSNPVEFFSRRTKSLYFPYLFYCLGVLVLNNYFVKFGFIPSQGRLDSWPVFFRHFYSVLVMTPIDTYLIGAMWFVPALFLCSITFNLLSYLLRLRFAQDNEPARFFCINSLFLLGHWMAFDKWELPFYIDKALVALPFYYFGYLYNRHQHRLPLSIFYAMSAGLILLVCRPYGLIRMGFSEYVNPGFFLLCGCAGIVLCLFISARLSKFRLRGFVSYVGNNTMVVLALHMISFKLVSWLIVLILGLPHDLVSANAKTVIPNINQIWRLFYLMTGLLLPLLIKFSFNKLASLIVPQKAVIPVKAGSRCQDNPL